MASTSDVSAYMRSRGVCEGVIADEAGYIASAYPDFQPVVDGSLATYLHRCGNITDPELPGYGTPAPPIYVPPVPQITLPPPNDPPSGPTSWPPSLAPTSMPPLEIVADTRDDLTGRFTTQGVTPAGIGGFSTMQIVGFIVLAGVAFYFSQQRS